jgi:hypothetical protein
VAYRAPKRRSLLPAPRESGPDPYTPIASTSLSGRLGAIDYYEFFEELCDSPNSFVTRLLEFLDVGADAMRRLPTPINAAAAGTRPAGRLKARLRVPCCLRYRSFAIASMVRRTIGRPDTRLCSNAVSQIERSPARCNALRKRSASAFRSKNISLAPH